MAFLSADTETCYRVSGSTPQILTAVCVEAQSPDIGRAYLVAGTSFSTPEGGDGPVMPSEILLWSHGKVPTTKGVFLFDDKSREIVLADWAQRFANAPRPDGFGPGSFDFDHDEWNEKLPGYQKLSAGSFDLGLDGKHAMCINCRPTERAADLIKRREKRSTSSAFEFDAKSGRFLRLYNNALTNIPATFNQAILCSVGAKVLLPPATDHSAILDRNMIQVPANFEITPTLAKDALLGILNGDRGAEAAVRLFGMLGQTERPITDDRTPKPDDETADRAFLGAVPHTKYPVDDTETWDGDAARGRLRKWASSDGSGDWAKVSQAKYAKGFGYVADHGEHESDYKLPHHDVKADHLVTPKKGVEAAGNAIQGARAPVGIPESDLPAVKAHLAAEYHLFDMRAPWEPKPAATSQSGQTAQDNAAKTAASTTQRLSMFEHMNAQHLLRLKMGHCADDMMMSAALMGHAKAAGQQEHASMHEEHLAKCAEHMGGLTKHAITLGMKAAAEMDGPNGSDDGDVSIPAAHLSAYKSAAQYGAIRSLLTVAQVHAALGIAIADGSDAKIGPAILSIKQNAADATSAAAKLAIDKGRPTAASNSAQAAAKVTELSAAGLCAPAQASAMLGLNPVTGKKDPLYPAYTLAQVEDFETQAKANRGQLAGAGIVPPPLVGQPHQQPQIDPAAGLLTPSDEEVTSLMAMTSCTKEEAIATLKANRAGSYGPAVTAAPAKSGRNALLSLLREALKDEE